MKTLTLRPDGSSGPTLVMAFVFLLLYLAIAEAFARSEMVRSALTAPSMGSKHRQFEEQISRIESFASDHESIDCIFLGDSTVQTGFAPSVFEQAYSEQTGKKIECINFGVGSSTVASSAVLAQILVLEYQPRLLIFGIHALNFTATPEAAGARALLETPWIRYKLGQMSIKGWLYEYSYLYRYLNIFRQLVSFETSFYNVSRGELDELPSRYYPVEGQDGPLDIANPPAPDSKDPYDEQYFGALGNFQLLPINLEALDQIADLASTTTRIVTVEMPVSKTYFYYFDGGEQAYRAFIEEIDQKLSAKSVKFWQTSYLDRFPDDVWFNRNHLNIHGAELFSEWLGEQVGKTIEEGKG